jgi:hypothetical protein
MPTGQPSAQPQSCPSIAPNVVPTGAPISFEYKIDKSKAAIVYGSLCAWALLMYVLYRWFKRNKITPEEAYATKIRAFNSIVPDQSTLELDDNSDISNSLHPHEDCEIEKKTHINKSSDGFAEVESDGEKESKVDMFDDEFEDNTQQECRIRKPRRRFAIADQKDGSFDINDDESTLRFDESRVLCRGPCGGTRRVELFCDDCRMLLCDTCSTTIHSFVAKRNHRVLKWDDIV